MNHKQRIAKLEKQKSAPKNPDILGLRSVDYRAGIVLGIPEPADSIPLKWVDYYSKQKAGQNEQP